MLIIIGSLLVSLGVLMQAFPEASGLEGGEPIEPADLWDEEPVRS